MTKLSDLTDVDATAEIPGYSLQRIDPEGGDIAFKFLPQLSGVNTDSPGTPDAIVRLGVDSVSPDPTTGIVDLSDHLLQATIAVVLPPASTFPVVRILLPHTASVDSSWIMVLVATGPVSDANAYVFSYKKDSGIYSSPEDDLTIQVLSDWSRPTSQKVFWQFIPVPESPDAVWMANKLVEGSGGSSALAGAVTVPLVSNVADLSAIDAAGYTVDLTTATGHATIIPPDIATHPSFALYVTNGSDALQAGDGYDFTGGTVNTIYGQDCTATALLYLFTHHSGSPDTWDVSVIAKEGTPSTDPVPLLLNPDNATLPAWVDPTVPVESLGGQSIYDVFGLIAVPGLYRCVLADGRGQVEGAALYLASLDGGEGGTPEPAVPPGTAPFTIATMPEGSRPTQTHASVVTEIGSDLSVGVSAGLVGSDGRIATSGSFAGVAVYVAQINFPRAT